MKNIVLTSLVALMFTSAALAQHDLAFYADVMVNATKYAHRQQAAELFHDQFLTALGADDSQTRPFENIEWISILTPSDETFRLFSWQVRVDDDKYTYYAVLQHRENPKLALIEFSDTRTLSNERSSFTPEAWYGALYYGIQDFKLNGETAYLLLGFNAMDGRTNQKVCDVLIIIDNKVSLGAPVFVAEEGGAPKERNRIIIEYADATVGSMKFDREREMLVYDHIITVNGGTDGGPMNVPDGSYHAYQFKKGKWYFVDKVFNVKLDQPPGDGLPKEEGARDILGRKKN